MSIFDNFANSFHNAANLVGGAIARGNSSTRPGGGSSTVNKPTYKPGSSGGSSVSSGSFDNLQNNFGSAMDEISNSLGNLGNIAGSIAGGIGNKTDGYKPLDGSGFDYAGAVGMSDEDRNAIAAAKELYNRGQALGDKNMMALAHQQAESIRKKYGYSGGTDGSMYILDESMLMPEFQIPGYDEFYNASGYGDAANSLQNATNAYIDQLEQSTGAQREQVGKNYDEAARQAYISYMNSRRTLPQRLSAMGSTGGLADSQQIALDAELQNNQNNIEMQRQNALQELQNLENNNKLAAQQTYFGNLANLGQQAASDYQNFYQNEANRYYNQFNQNRDFNTTQDLTQQQTQQAQQQQMWENALALWQTYGYATQAIANVLGVPVGALPEGTAYNNALLELEMIKAGL